MNKFNVARASEDIFKPLVRDTFRVAVGSQTIELTLDNIKIFENSGVRDTKVVVEGVEIPAKKAFALTLEGPREPVLDPTIYALSHDTLGTMQVYMSPFRQDATSTLYEVVFN
ncbi:DUF6916 family protein [Candidatus Rhodobacter oscarellae]|uniref:DUF6916 family protein n=1 Tax=Candidatus Rhodobacter oscarellae TaxID=1675527 RepID=UPI0006717A87|nr:hypothetical protein [Candidatus Rhodobacter lobularis]